MYRLLKTALNHIIILYTFFAGAHAGAGDRKVLSFRQLASIRAMHQLYCEMDLGRPIAINTAMAQK